MFPVTCPEHRAVYHGASRDQGVAKIDAVAFLIAPEVIACLAARISVDRNARQSKEQVGQRSMFLRKGPGPEFREADWRIDNIVIRLAQINPTGQHIFVSTAGDFDKNVGINQHAHFRARSFSRWPRRSSRTIATASFVSPFRLRLPTNASMALCRSSRFPG
jgi:hypothetical protein